MKDDLSKKTVMVIDNGLFTELAKTLSSSFKKVYYTCRWKSAFPKSEQYVIGYGIEGIERVDDIWDKFDEVDLFVFPDIYDGSLQLHLESLGKLVFGGKLGEQMELYRDSMKEHMKKLGLYVTPYKVIKSIQKLREYLKENPNVWVKQNVTRGDFECVDDQTEIFTDEGWKYFSELNKKEKVLTMNPETLESEFVKPSHYFESFYEGDMYSVETDKVSMLTTPLHKYFVRHGAKSKLRYKKISDLKPRLKKEDSYFNIPIGFKWNGNTPTEYTVRETFSHTHKSGDKTFEMKTWLKFLAWFISEGSCTFKGYKKTKHCVTISQCLNKNPEKYAEIESVLKEMGYNYQIEGKIGFSIYNKSLFYELKKTCYEQTECDNCGKLTSCCHSKLIPDYVKGLSPELIEVFISTYVKGDGYLSKSKWGYERRFCTSSETLAHDIQELIMKMGKVARLLTVGKKGDVRIYKDRKFINRADQFEIRELKSINSTVKSKNITIVNYSGFIYDVTVEPYHSILVRRNNKYCWTGNTFYSKNYDLVEPVLDELEHKLGAVKYIKEFIVEDAYDDAVETGLDCYCIDGEYPSQTLAGVEIKDCGYCGVIVPYKKLPEQITDYNEKISQTMKDFGYRGFFSTEIRVSSKLPPYMVDKCARCGSPPSELYQIMYKNLAEIVWYGAKGELVDPEFNHKFGVEALIHSAFADQNWQAISFPKKYRNNIKLRNACCIEGKYYCAPQKTGLVEIGAVVATGDTLEEAIAEAKKIAETVEGHYIEVKIDSFDKAQEEFKKLSDIGIKIL